MFVISMFSTQKLKFKNKISVDQNHFKIIKKENNSNVA